MNAAGISEKLKNKKKMSKSILRLCDYNQPGDVPEVTVKCQRELMEMIEYWLHGKDSYERVYVCFNSYTGVPYESNHPTIIITNRTGQVWDYMKQESTHLFGEWDFNLFEFDKWEEALQYCLELKEGL